MRYCACLEEPMPADRPRTTRTLLIPDHLWDVFASMASEMGADRDALVNQAMYTFARLNGFLVPSDLRNVSSADAVSASHAGAANVDEDASPLPGSAASGATSMELPNLSEYGVLRIDGGTRGISTRAQARSARDDGFTGRVLVLFADGHELDRVTKNRFVIGRGKHCDLVINSGKVSREHAAIVREGNSWFIEDLGSSNGTWFDKRRLTRREIQEGDEYYVCAEKLRCTFN